MEVGGKGGLSFRHDAFEIPRDIQARMSRGMLRETKGLKTQNWPRQPQCLGAAY